MTAISLYRSSALRSLPLAVCLVLLIVQCCPAYYLVANFVVYQHSGNVAQHSLPATKIAAKSQKQIALQHTQHLSLDKRFCGNTSAWVPQTFSLTTRKHFKSLSNTTIQANPSLSLSRTILFRGPPAA